MAKAKRPTLAQYIKRGDVGTARTIAQHLAGAGNSAAIPTSLLGRLGLTDIARKRALNARLDTAVVPGSQMSNRDLAREANASVATQYGPQQALLKRQEQATPGYYAAYVDALKGNQQAAQAQGQQSAQAIQGLYSSGPQAPGSAQSNVGAAQAGTASLLGQTQANFQGALAAAAQSGALQALGAVHQKQQDLAAQMGAANVTYHGKRRSEEAQNVATTAIANQNAIARGATAAETHRHNVVQETKPPSAADQKTAADLAFFKKHGYYPPTGPPKPPKAPKGPKATPRITPARVDHYVSQATQVASMLLHPPTFQPTDPKTNKPKGNPRPATRQEILSDIRAGTSSLGKGIDPRVVNIGLSLADNRNQGVGPWGAGQAQSLGIPTDRFKRVKTKVKKVGVGTGGGAITNAISGVTGG